MLALQCNVGHNAAWSSSRGKELKDILRSVPLAPDVNDGIRHDMEM